MSADWLFLSAVGGNLPQDSPQAIGRLWVNFDNPWSVDESPICHHFHMASPCVHICLCVQISLFKGHWSYWVGAYPNDLMLTYLYKDPILK